MIYRTIGLKGLTIFNTLPIGVEALLRIALAKVPPLNQRELEVVGLQKQKQL